MKIVELCCSGICPVVKLDDDRVEIGEAGNLVVLTLSQWDSLRQKILSNEL